MINGIITVLVKNFKIIFKSKKYYAIFFLFPIIVMFIFGGLYFNTQSYKLTVGLIVPEKTPLYENYHYALKNSGFSLMELEDIDVCSDYIERSIVNVCILFPKDFNIKDGAILQLNFVIDSTKKNLLPIIENFLIEIINAENNRVKEKVIYELIENIQIGKQVTNISNGELKGIVQNMSEIEDDLKILDRGILSFKKIVSRGKWEVLVLLKDSGSKEIGDSLKSLKENIYSIENEAERIESLINKTQLSPADRNSFSSYVDSILDKVVSMKSDINNVDGLESLEGKFKSILSDFESLELEGKNIDNMLFKTRKEISSLKAKTVAVKNLQERHNLKLNNISILNAKTVLTPINFKVTSSNLEQTENHLNSMFPALLMGFVCLLSVFLSSNFVYSERRTQSYFRNVLTKQGSFVFFVGNFLSLFFIVYMLSCLFVLFYDFYFLEFIDIGMEIFVLIIPIIAIFVLIGMFIGNVVPNSLINFFANFFVILIFLLLSGKIFPLEVLSENLIIKFAYFNPFFLGEAILRRFYFFGATVLDLKLEIGFLSKICGGLFVLLLFIESIIMKRGAYFMFVRLRLFSRWVFNKNGSMVNDFKKFLKKETSKKKGN
jgi:hypothetical protein